jgi:hypothetical protein
MELEEKVKVLRSNLGVKKKQENESVTKQRMVSVLKDRDEAMRSIYDYQDKTGIPSKEETEKNFFEIEIKN